METTILGRGSFATFGRCVHGPGEHHDPAEERFSSSTVIFTTHGSWSVHGHDGWIEADRDTVVLGHAGDSYRCAHTSHHPDDRAVFVEIDDTALRDLLDGHPDAGLLDNPLPPQRSVHLDAALASRLTAVEAPENDSALRLDCLAIEVLLDLRAERPRLRRAGRRSGPVRCRRRAET